MYGGQPQDYDGWAETGLTDWNWEHMLAAYEAIEDHQLGADDMRGDLILAEQRGE